MQPNINFPRQQTAHTRNGFVNRRENADATPLPAPSTAPPRGNIQNFNMNGQPMYPPQFIPIPQPQMAQMAPNLVYLPGQPYAMMNPSRTALPVVRPGGPKPNFLYGGYPHTAAPNPSGAGHRPTFSGPIAKEKKILSIVDPNTKQAINIKRENVSNSQPEKVEIKPTVNKGVAESSTIKDEFYKQVLAKIKPGEKSEAVKQEEYSEIKSNIKHVEEKPVIKELNIPSEKINGKICYSIPELEKVRDMFTECPEVMQELDWDQVICETPSARSRGSAFSNKNRQGSSRQQANPKWNRSNKAVRVTTSIPVEVKLHQAENAWKPLSQSQQLSDHEKVLSETKSMLNKLSKENFDKLSLSFATLAMPSLVTYRVFTNLIREKALLEPTFADMYAELCAILESKIKKGAPKSYSKIFPFFNIVRREGQFFWTTGVKLSPEEIKEKYPYIPQSDCVQEFGPFSDSQSCEKNAVENLQFKRFLLQLCQRQFDQKNVFDDVRAEKELLKKKVLSLENSPEKERDLIEAQIELNDAKAKETGIKRSMISNFNFIGELFLQNLISAGIVSFCLSKLGNIKPNQEQVIPEPENVECLCKLLTIIGKKFDSKENVVYLNVLFQAIKIFSESPQLDNRHRFMCLDVVELRGKGWKGKDTRSKTKDEVRNEALAEEAKQRASLNSYTGKSTSSKMKYKRNNGMNSNQASNSVQGTRYINASKLGMRPRGGTKTLSVLKKVVLDAEEKQKIRSKAKSALREFARGGPASEVVLYLTDELDKIPHLKLQLKAETTTVFVGGVLNFFVDGTESERLAVAKVCKVLSDSGKVEVNADKLRNVLLTLSNDLQDIEIDAPKVGEYFGSLLFNLLNESCITDVDVKTVFTNLKKSSASILKKVYKRFAELISESKVKLNYPVSSLEK